jgi:hypothetical protein
MPSLSPSATDRFRTLAAASGVEVRTAEFTQGPRTAQDAAQAVGQQTGRERRTLSGTREDEHGIGAAQALAGPDFVGRIAGHDEVGGKGFAAVEPEGEALLAVCFVSRGRCEAALGEE